MFKKKILTHCGRLTVITLVLTLSQGCSYKNRQRQHQYEHLGRALNRVSSDVVFYTIENKELPSPPFKNVLAKLESGGIQMDEYPYSVIADGEDPWGHKIIYVRQSDSKAILRSVGANGSDEGGRGDDVERVISIPAKEG